MVKLTVELIARTGAGCRTTAMPIHRLTFMHGHIDPFLNPLKDRELDLRGALIYQCTRYGPLILLAGLKIPAIENLGATKVGWRRLYEHLTLLTTFALRTPSTHSTSQTMPSSRFQIFHD